MPPEEQPTYWSPSSYLGATDDFKRARTRECCILLGRALHREPETILGPAELLPFAPAIATTLKTILTFRGANAGAYGFLLKDALICEQAGWKEPAAMMLGLADRFLDPFFSGMRRWGGETFVQSVFAVLSRLSRAILDGTDNPADRDLLGHIAESVVANGLSSVPGVPDAAELFSRSVTSHLNECYTIVRDDERMILMKERLLNPEEENPREYKIERRIAAQVAVCAKPDDLLTHVWSEYNRLKLHGPVDSSNIAAPTLGDFGESTIYRTRLRNAVGEIVCPFYAARFESGFEGLIPFRWKDEAKIGEVLIVGDEDREGTRVVGIDVQSKRWLFEYLMPSADREKICEWLPGMGGDWSNRQFGRDEEKGLMDEDTRVFIVHGHADRLKWELKNYLQNTVGLPEPIILHEQPNLGRNLMEKFEDFASTATLAFVLLTPDDVGSAADAADADKRRARQNVIFEMGYFLGLLRRASGRVILLHQGPLELPSDIAGLVYIDISGGIESAGERIRRELSDLLA